jgi:hypothetical protein
LVLAEHQQVPMCKQTVLTAFLAVSLLLVAVRVDTLCKVMMAVLVVVQVLVLVLVRAVQVLSIKVFVVAILQAQMVRAVVAVLAHKAVIKQTKVLARLVVLV